MSQRQKIRNIEGRIEEIERCRDDLLHLISSHVNEAVADAKVNLSQYISSNSKYLKVIQTLDKVSSLLQLLNETASEILDEKSDTDEECVIGDKVDRTASHSAGLGRNTFTTDSIRGTVPSLLSSSQPMAQFTSPNPLLTELQTHPRLHNSTSEIRHTNNMSQYNGPVLPTDKNSSPHPLCEYLPFHLDYAVVYRICVVQVMNPYYFLIRTLGAQLERIIDNLVRFAMYADPRVQVPPKLQLKTPCLVRNDAHWYRGRIVHIPTPFDASGMVDVEFVDYGVTKGVSVSQMCHVPEHLFALPMQSGYVALAKVGPTTGNIKWSSNATSALRNLTDMVTIQCCCLTHGESPIPLVQLHCADKSQLIDINQLLVTNRLAQALTLEQQVQLLWNIIEQNSEPTRRSTNVQPTQSHPATDFDYSNSSQTAGYNQSSDQLQPYAHSLSPTDTSSDITLGFRPVVTEQCLQHSTNQYQINPADVKSQQPQPAYQPSHQPAYQPALTYNNLSKVAPQMVPVKPGQMRNRVDIHGRQSMPPKLETSEKVQFSDLSKHNLPIYGDSHIHSRRSPLDVNTTNDNKSPNASHTNFIPNIMPTKHYEEHSLRQRFSPASLNLQRFPSQAYQQNTYRKKSVSLKEPITSSVESKPVYTTDKTRMEMDKTSYNFSDLEECKWQEDESSESTHIDLQPDNINNKSQEGSRARIRHNQVQNVDESNGAIGVDSKYINVEDSNGAVDLDSKSIIDSNKSCLSPIDSSVNKGSTGVQQQKHNYHLMRLRDKQSKVRYIRGCSSDRDGPLTKMNANISPLNMEIKEITDNMNHPNSFLPVAQSEVLPKHIATKSTSVHSVNINSSPIKISVTDVPSSSSSLNISVQNSTSTISRIDTSVNPSTCSHLDSNYTNVSSMESHLSDRLHQSRQSNPHESFHLDAAVKDCSDTSTSGFPKSATIDDHESCYRQEPQCANVVPVVTPPLPTEATRYNTMYRQEPQCANVVPVATPPLRTEAMRNNTEYRQEPQCANVVPVATPPLRTEAMRNNTEYRQEPQCANVVPVATPPLRTEAMRNNTMYRQEPQCTNVVPVATPPLRTEAMRNNTMYRQEPQCANVVPVVTPPLPTEAMRNNTEYKQEPQCANVVPVVTPLLPTEATRNNTENIVKNVVMYFNDIVTEMTEYLGAEPCQVLMSYVISPAHFYVNLVINGQALKDIEKEIQNFHSGVCNMKKLSLSFSIKYKSLYLGRYNDGVLYRALIIDPPIDDNPHTNCRVFFVDYGNTDSVMRSDLFPIPNSLSAYDFQATKCSLAFVSPIWTNGKECGQKCAEDDWSDEAQTEFTKLDNNEKLFIYVVPKDEKCEMDFTPVVLMDTSDDHDVCINARLVQQQLAQFVPPESGWLNKDCLDNWDPLREAYTSHRNSYRIDVDNPGIATIGIESQDHKVCRYFNLPMGCNRGDRCARKHINPAYFIAESTEVYSAAFSKAPLPQEGWYVVVNVSAVYNPQVFYIVMPWGCQPLSHLIQTHSHDTQRAKDDVEQLQDMSENMTEHYNSITFQQQYMLVAAVGSVVAVQDNQDMKWYRAQVISTDPEEFRVLVLFVDFGIRDSVSETRVREIEPQFLHLPFQAVECYITGILPANDSTGWSEETNDYFWRLVEGKSLVAHVVESLHDSLNRHMTSRRLGVELIDTLGDKEVVIMEKLIEAKLAKFE